MATKEYEDDEQELLDLGRKFFASMEAKQRYDPMKAKAYYQRNRDTIIQMNKQYYTNHRNEYIQYLRNYCTENRELMYKRDKLRSVVRNKIIQRDVDNAVETFVNEVMQPISVESSVSDDFTLRQQQWSDKKPGRPKAGSKPKKPYTYVRQEGPFVLEFT